LVVGTRFSYITISIDLPLPDPKDGYIQIYSNCNIFRQFLRRGLDVFVSVVVGAFILQQSLLHVCVCAFGAFGGRECVCVCWWQPACFFQCMTASRISWKAFPSKVVAIKKLKAAAITKGKENTKNTGRRARQRKRESHTHWQPLNLTHSRTHTRTLEQDWKLAENKLNKKELLKCVLSNYKVNKKLPGLAVSKSPALRSGNTNNNSSIRIGKRNCVSSISRTHVSFLVSSN